MAKKCISKKCAKITLYVAITVFIVTLVILIVFPTIYKKQLAKDIALTKGSLVSNIWEDIPLPIHERLYFFNVTNAEDFVKRGAKLNVTQLGPYTYKSRWTKNPVWNNNGTVSYREIRTYQFVPEKSVGGQDDIVHTLNGPMIIAANILKDYSIWIRIGASFLMKLESEDIVTIKTVRELVYEGYEDVIIKYAPIVKSNIPYKDGIFSWLYGKNATDDGLFTVFTGEDDPDKTDFVERWNGEDHLNFWNGDSCNMINGTSIETGPPLKGDEESYTFFQSIFCRSLTFDYVGNVTHHDILARRFQPTSQVFANGTENPDNSCYDLTPGMASGVLDVSPCQYGAPVFISFPHFHLADPSYLNVINGLNPNADEHGSHLDVEYVTGVSINILVRFQVNVQLSRVKGIFQFDDVPEGIFPIFWAELNLEIDDDFANFLKRSMNNPKIIAHSILGILMGASLIAAIVAIVILRTSKEDDEELIIVRDDDKALSASINARNSKTGYGTNESEKNSKYHDGSKGITNKTLDLSSDVGFSETESTDVRSAPSRNEAAILHVDVSTPSKM